MQTINNISGLIQEIQDIKKRHGVTPDQRLLFRGVRDIGYELVPKLARGDVYEALQAKNPDLSLLEIQHLLLGRFKRFGSRFVSNARMLSEIEWLCIAQHYGLPTLLLDWSLDPLVSCYFASLQSEKHQQQRGAASAKDPSGALHVLITKKRFHRRQRTYYLGEAADNMAIYIDKTLKRKNRRQSDVKQLVGPKLIIPMREDPRINAQVGRFIYVSPGNLRKEKKLRNKTKHKLPDLRSDRWYKTKRPWAAFEMLEIPKKSKETVKNELQMLQIHGGRIFPELQEYAKYLASGGL